MATSRVISSRFSSLECTALLFVSLPIILFLCAEPHDRHFWVGIRVVELFDLFLITPSLILSLVSFHFHLLESATRKVRVFSVVLIVIFSYFQAVHWTANLFNTFLTEWEPARRAGISKHSVPEELYELIYWLDEYLSHLILFTAMYSELILCVIQVSPCKAK